MYCILNFLTNRPSDGCYKNNRYINEMRANVTFISKQGYYIKIDISNCSVVTNDIQYLYTYFLH